MDDRIKAISDAGFEWVIGLEGGLRLRAYWDADGEVWTIGGGLTYLIVPGGTKRRITATDSFANEAEARLMQRKVIQHYETLVDLAFRDDITQIEFDAFTSLAWNCEIAVSPKWSSLPGLFNGYAPLHVVISKLMEYRRSGGRVVPGLVARRACEAHLLKTGQYVLQGQVPTS